MNLILLHTVQKIISKFYYGLQKVIQNFENHRGIKEWDEEFHNMAKRITIILDDDLLKKLHEIQAKQIKESTKSVSLSRVLNETLRKSLKR